MRSAVVTTAECHRFPRLPCELAWPPPFGMRRWGWQRVEGQPHRGALGIRTTAEATGSEAGDSLDGLAPMPVLFAYTNICNQKVQRPFQCA